MSKPKFQMLVALRAVILGVLDMWPNHMIKRLKSFKPPQLFNER